MGLVRVVFGLFVGFVLLLFARLLSGGRKRNAGGGRRGPGAPDPAHRLVRCEACGTAVPESRALPLPSPGTGFACSRDCEAALVRLAG